MVSPKDDPPSTPSSRPSFTSFWKRTKDAATAATQPVTFLPVNTPRASKNRVAKKRPAAIQSVTEDTKPHSSSNNNNNEHAQDVSRGSNCNNLGDDRNDQGQENSSEGQDGGQTTTGDEARDESPREAQQRTAKEKAQARRAQVRRAQIQHRKRKAEYMRRLELDIDMLRDMVTTAEQEMRAIQKDNDAIRVQLGIVSVVRKDNSTVGLGSGIVGSGVGVGGEMGGREGKTGPADVTMSDVPVLSITSASTTASPSEPVQNMVDSMTASFPPLSISPVATATTAASSYLSTTVTSPGGTVSTGMDSTGSPTSIFTGIDLDDINVSIVMDEAIGNPVYQISSLNPNVASSLVPPVLPDAVDPDTLDCPASPFDPGFVPSFETELASSGDSTGNDFSHAATAFILPDLTVAETHQIVNFILSLEHVCWGHAGHQFHDPRSEMSANDGHVMMATSLFLREAPEAVFSTIESTTAGLGAYITNTEPDNRTATCNHLHTHQVTEGITWQAPDVTLHTLYGLAVSLNPMSDMELAPVQAWFELAARYPLSILLRADVVDALKRGLVGVVRCLYFGAVMERDAFENVVQRVIGPVMEAEEAAVAAQTLVDVSPQVLNMPSTTNITAVTDFAGIL